MYLLRTFYEYMYRFMYSKCICNILIINSYSFLIKKYDVFN